jgi:hypothetical protein
MTSLSRSLMAAVLLAILAAAPAHADTAHVRIEGDGVSLSKTVDVPTSGTFGPDACPYDSPGGAIEIATGGNWDRKAFTQTILGETRTYSDDSTWWNFWLNREWSNVGICDASRPLQDGDEVLMIVQRDDASFNPTVFPLFITQAPQAVERGAPAQFSVAEHTYSYPTTSKGPAAGVTVAGGGATATTGADGQATLSFAEAGSFEVRATAPQRARSNAAVVVVTDPGQPAPAEKAPSTLAPPPVCLHDGDDGRCGTVDRQAPSAFITSIREGAVFRRGRGPRRLAGTAGLLGAAGIRPDGSGILMIKLRLTRAVGPRCSTWSPSRERFVPRPCGAGKGFWFRIGDAPKWEYLLPARLPRGRYVFDADAIDRNGNRLRSRKRGENRVVFRVR